MTQVEGGESRAGTALATELYRLKISTTKISSFVQADNHQ
jgi:hypothetical protein